MADQVFVVTALDDLAVIQYNDGIAVADGGESMGDYEYGTAFHQVIVLRNQNVWLLLYILLISTITDIFAYLIGKLMGKKKIFPTISPNKTYAGTIGGIIFGKVIPTVFYVLVISNECILEVAITSFILSIISVFGDLLFSKIKRENDIKDFSDLIPGHGGILDRFDSFIFVVLAYTIIQRFI